MSRGVSPAGAGQGPGALAVQLLLALSSVASVVGAQMLISWFYDDLR